ncbi:hypothetical protein SKAU_G00398570 [Synaphobranchus kaupii]|uniref:Uncharacterized protein n=1 Tax=Synaphobranchus kaupii TaxID=118154 RepID=A0A9Q1E8I9_SYNKA|nr:hypothetical protein SKAU_G00398570 [Synaphobranchus kaupii]
MHQADRGVSRSEDPPSHALKPRAVFSSSRISSGSMNFRGGLSDFIGGVIVRSIRHPLFLEIGFLTKALKAHYPACCDHSNLPSVHAGGLKACSKGPSYQMTAPSSFPLPA